jgi:hypothetical protein
MHQRIDRKGVEVFDVGLVAGNQLVIALVAVVFHQDEALGVWAICATFS